MANKLWGRVNVFAINVRHNYEYIFTVFAVCIKITRNTKNYISIRIVTLHYYFHKIFK